MVLPDPKREPTSVESPPRSSRFGCSSRRERWEERLDLTKINGSRYLCFRDEFTLALGRLTILYGENSSGKSALVRLPALLAGSMEGPPGLSATAASQGLGFLGLRWRGRLPEAEPDDLRFGLTLGGHQVAWSLRWHENLRQGVVDTASFTLPEHNLRLQWQPDRADASREARSYRLEGGEIHTLRFHGLCPEFPEGFSPPIRAQAGELQRLRERVHWLQAIRVGPSREGISIDARPPPSPQGGAWAESRVSDPEVVAKVSSWYQGATQAEFLIETRDSYAQCVLQSTAESGPKVAFPHVGEGLQQVFPVLVALEELRRHGGLLCIEEPESHLHPRLQRRLIERMVEVLLEQPEAQILLETHSEVLLYAALLQAATGALESGVQLYWLAHQDGASSLQPVPLDAQGRPERDELLRAFSTMGALRREVILARRRGGPDAG